MGIPSYFSYVIKNYANIIRDFNHFFSATKNPFSRLYMDCNSIIYDSYNDLKSTFDNMTVKEVEDAIINEVISRIENYICMIKPTQTVYIAFDGVAPFAKMNQQKTRRYKTSFMSGINSTGDNKTVSWNTINITPGTEFMDNLCYRIDYHLKHTETRYGVKEVIISCSDKPGEGEHKLYKHIRTVDMQHEKIAVYGLDSDLIMLSIFHLDYCKNIYIFREAPEFLKGSIPVDTSNNQPYFVDIQNLASGILSHMNCKYSSRQRINDYVFLCFFLGNDFLPHFPAMNIRTHGIDVLLEIYTMKFGNKPNCYFISEETGKIVWRNVRLFIQEVAKNEHQFLLNEYFVRNKFENYKLKEDTDEEKERVINNMPVLYRAEEKYICPQEQYWEKRYYKALFHMDKTPDNVKTISTNYLQGLEWVYKYYIGECPDWRWKYNYHYPPLFGDLLNYIPHFDTDFIKNGSTQPFHPHSQLAYIMPKQYIHLLPKNKHSFIINNYSEFYPNKYDFCWAFCRYFWESHPLLPEIPLQLLEQWDTQFNHHDVTY